MNQRSYYKLRSFEEMVAGNALKPAKAVKVVNEDYSNVQKV